MVTSVVRRTETARVAHDVARARDRSETLTGTRRLVRLVLRRDRVRLALWIVGLVGVMTVSAQSVASLYDTPAQLVTYTSTVGDNPALVIFAGPGYGFDDPTIGAVLVNETMLWMSIGVGLMSVFLVNRHTRVEEESERADLVRSAVVGRHAQLAATLVVAAAANLVVAAASAVALAALGFPLAGSIALCAAIGLVGVVFAAATAVAVQVASTGRGALGLGTGALAAAFVVRGIGDVSAPVLSWLTPFGWGIGVRAYADERWWTLLGLAAFAGVLVVAADALSDRRDLGSGLIPQRPGPATASPLSRRPLGLAFRLQRGALLGWSVGLGAAGLVYGGIADEIEAMVADNPELADFLASIGGASITDAYLARSIGLLALLTTGFAISSTLRARSDESAGHAELMLVTPLTRWWWAGSRFVVTIAGSALLVVVFGVTTGIGYAYAVDDAAQVGRLLGAALVTLPAVLVLAGVAAALFGWLPRATPAAWVVFALAAIVSLFGPILQLPEWVIELAPLELVPAMPAERWSAGHVVGLGVSTAVLFSAALVGFRRRDLAPG